MNLLERLRQGTRAAHEALHVHPLLAPLVSPDVTLGDYRFALLAFDAFYSRLEAEPAMPWPVETAPVRDWLAHDLAVQGLSPIGLDIDLPRLDTLSKVWGYLYVKQGSTLGGNVMTKALRRNLGLQPHDAQRFFAGYGDENGKRWQKFIENLFAEASLLDQTETVDSAVACFDGIARICDAVLRLKTSDRINVLQASGRTERKAT